jgi:UDP-N-acetylmuramoylalanine--D-glutamate ligase
MDLKDKKVLVIGMAKSGVSAALLCNKYGAKVTVSDTKTADKIGLDIQVLLDKGIEVLLGTKADDIVVHQELIVISPGVPIDIAAIKKANELNIPVIGEIELAYRFSKAPIIAITGTNGKTTTTILTGEILKAFNNNVEVVGNVGVPFCDKVEQVTQDGFTVVEISSFQMETAYEFRPKVSAVLNITPDHLDRHKTYENYIATKEKIFKNQQPEDYCILNYDDDICRGMANRTEAKVIFFSTKQILSEGIYLDNTVIKANINGVCVDICDIDQMQIFGNHNIQNAMAAIAMAICVSAPIDRIKKTIVEFKGVEHRIEYVATVDGVAYYNDSKGTNPDASIQAIKAMKHKTVLIGGGYDKNSDFTDWIEAFDGKVKKLILIGATAQKIKDTAEKLGFKDSVIVQDFKTAVDLAHTTASQGECVLLSPACASWGMFDNYEQRGEIFKAIVHSYQNS